MFLSFSLILSETAKAASLNLDPYFGLGFTALQVDAAGQKSTSPAFYFAIGSKLNWLTPNLGAELRMGFGGQYATFDGDINGYTSLLLKPSFDVSQHLDVFALVGVTTMSVNVLGASSNDTQLSYGTGFAYRIPNESISFTAEWMQYLRSSNQSTTSISGMDISGVSVSFVYAYE